jgi:hypothetical protein
MEGPKVRNPFTLTRSWVFCWPKKENGNGIETGEEVSSSGALQEPGQLGGVKPWKSVTVPGRNRIVEKLGGRGATV